MAQHHSAGRGESLNHLITSAEVRGPWVLHRSPKAVRPAPHFTGRGKSAYRLKKPRALPLRAPNAPRRTTCQCGHSSVLPSGSPRGLSVGPIARVPGNPGDHRWTVIHPKSRALHSSLMKSGTRQVSVRSCWPHSVAIFL